MDDKRKTLHIQNTAVKFRHKSAKTSRKAFSSGLRLGTSDQNLYRFEVYGNRDEISCYFLPSNKGGHTRRNPTSKQHSRKSYWLNENDVISARPVNRIHSAPRKLSYLDNTGSQGTGTNTNRPQTVAPCVRDISDTPDCTGVLLSGGVTAEVQTSDKHDIEPALYNTEGRVGNRDYYNRNNDPALGTLLENHNHNHNGIQVSRDVKVLDLKNGSLANDEYLNGDENPLLDDFNNDNVDTKMNMPGTKHHVTFAHTLLSGAKYVHSKTLRAEQKIHEDKIEKLRQSYGISAVVDDAKVNTENIQLDTQVVKDTTSSVEPVQSEHGETTEDKATSRRRKPAAKSTKRRTAGASGQGYLVKNLKEQRTNTTDTRNPSPVEIVTQQLMTLETKRSRRNVKGLFPRTSTFVWYVCRLLGCMVDLSAEITIRSATEEQWHALNTSQEARGMAFNKAAFAKRKDDTRVPVWAKKIMRKSPDDRTEQEVKRVHALLRGMKSFDRFTEKIQLSMCKSFVYYSINSGRVILRQGHIGQNFYFLFNGSVFVNIDDVDAKGNQFSKTEAILSRGDSFGELALLQDIRRTATITCREDCEMLVVDKDTFARICPRIFELELEEKLRFVSKMKLFNLRIWEEESIRKMCFEAQIQEYKTNKVVVVDSETDEWIYICMEGKCQVIRRMDLSEEIEWRKYHQQHGISSAARRNSRPDYLTVMTGLSNPALDRRESRRRSVNPAVKQNLLESMGLEFMQKRRLSSDDWKLLKDLKLQQIRERRTSKGDLASTLRPREGYGSLTLTSLLANDEKKNGNHLFLNIHTMKESDVFDFPSVLKGHEEIRQSTGSHILVSLGSRLMRIKRSSYFKHASADAIELAKGLALKDMYPSDDVLLQRYRDFLHWEVYKYQVLQMALGKKKKTNSSHNAKALFELNKTTLVELDGILGAESNKQTDWNQINELYTSSPTEIRVTHQVEQPKRLPSLNKAQLRAAQVGISGTEPSAYNRRVSMRPSHVTIAEMDEIYE